MKVLQYTENDVSMQNNIHFVHICTVINPGCIIKATVVQSCLTCDKRRRKLTISYCVRCNKTHFVLLKMYHFCISKIAFGATKHLFKEGPLTGICYSDMRSRQDTYCTDPKKGHLFKYLPHLSTEIIWFPADFYSGQLFSPDR